MPKAYLFNPRTIARIILAKTVLTVVILSTEPDSPLSVVSGCKTGIHANRYYHFNHGQIMVKLLSTVHRLLFTLQ